MNEPVIHYSPEAATYRTDIKGWVSRHGDTMATIRGGRVARWDGDDWDMRGVRSGLHKSIG